MIDADNPEQKNRIPPMMKMDWQTDQGQTIIQLEDGTIERHVTLDGKETRQRFHSSGAYSEWRPDGSSVHMSSNNQHDYTKGGTTVSIDQHGDVKISGHSRNNTDTDHHQESGKHFSLAFNGHLDVAAPKGHMKFAASELSFHSAQGSIVMNSARDVEMKAGGGRIGMQSKGVTTVVAGGDFHVDSSAQIDMKSKSDATIKSTGGNMTTQSDSKDNNMIATAGNANTKGKTAIQEATGGDNTQKASGAVKVSSQSFDAGHKQDTPDSTGFAG